MKKIMTILFRFIEDNLNFHLFLNKIKNFVSKLIESKSKV